MTNCIAFYRLLIFGCLTLAAPLATAAVEDPNNAFIEIYGSKETAAVDIAIKDNIDIAGKVTSAGSLALADNVALEDAFLIKKLRVAGFNIFGKTNLSEWANFRSTNSVSGWSSYGGQTSHVLGDNLNPCGSSSGSAVAVAAGFVEVAVGTETNGSISCPASVNGVVGMKPTVGLISRSGVIPIAASQDTAGALGSSVKIVARALAAMAGPDPQDHATQAIPTDFDYDLVAATSNLSLRGKKFGLLSSGSDITAASMLLQSLTTMVKALGGEVILLEDTRTYPSQESYLILLYEFKRGLEAYLASASEQKKTLQSLIDFNAKNEATAMPYFGQEIFHQALAVQHEYEAYANARRAIAEARDQTIELLDASDLDGFIGLTRGPAWLTEYNGGDDVGMTSVPRFANGHFAAIAGFPHITFPGFTIDGLPVGISIIGRPWSDKALLSYAAALEALIEDDPSSVNATDGNAAAALDSR
jgi:amidase